MKKILLPRGMYALVDDEFFEKLDKYNWSLDSNHYVNRRVTVKENKALAGKHIRMHRQVLDYFGKLDVDHINGNKLDNRLANLRICTRSQNHANKKNGWGKSGIKGVRRSGSGWQARIIYKGKEINGGTFIKITDARKKYENMAREYYGEFAA